MAARLTRLLVALGLLLGAALPSAAAAVVRLPTSQQIAASPVPDRGTDPVYARSYFGARYYRADLGQFTTVDPFQELAANLVEPQRWNRYTYALNSPLKLTDPDGRNPVLVVGGIIWGLYEIASSISDAYATYQTVRDLNASTTEKLTTGGLFAAGMLPMVPGGAATAGRAAIRGGDELAEAARAARTLGRQGEEAVRAAYDLGDKMRIVVNGRARVPDGLNELLGPISEVKNVSGQGVHQAAA